MVNTVPRVSDYRCKLNSRLAQTSCMWSSRYVVVATTLRSQAAVGRPLLQGLTQTTVRHKPATGSSNSPGIALWRDTSCTPGLCAEIIRGEFHHNFAAAYFVYVILVSVAVDLD